MRTAGKGWSLVFLCLTPLGCENSPPAPAPAVAAPVAIGALFDPSTAGSVQGRVLWEGELPVVAPFITRPHPLAGLGLRERLVRDNPNAPQIDPASRGVAGAVVFLRGVDAARARPWDHPSVTLELNDRRLFVRQGERETRAGIVRRGDPVSIVSRDRYFHSVHTDGAAYFSLTFPDADQPLSRTLDRAGVVEWSSNCGYYWLRGYTFVADHPYYALTDAHGQFRLPQVPPGEYEIVCWLPNWHIARRDLDPDMAIPWRVYFGPPLEQARPVAVKQNSTSDVEFIVGQRQHGP